MFREFQNYIISKDWNDARNMLFTIENKKEQNYSDNIYFYIKNRPTIENGKLISLGCDITNEIAKAKPRFWATYDYYISNPNYIDKVIIANGYILLLKGKILYIKIP